MSSRLFFQVVLLLLRAGASSRVILGGTFLRECLAVGALFPLLLTHTRLGRVEGLLNLVLRLLKFAIVLHKAGTALQFGPFYLILSHTHGLGTTLLLAVD